MKIKKVLILMLISLMFINPSINIQAKLNKNISKQAKNGDSEAQYKAALYYFNKINDNSLYKYAFEQEANNAVKQKELDVIDKIILSKANKKYKKAFSWLEKSAKQNYAEAQYKLGTCYVKGEGVKKDLQEALKWYQLASQNGSILADKQVNIINKEIYKNKEREIYKTGITYDNIIKYPDDFIDQKLAFKGTVGSITKNSEVNQIILYIDSNYKDKIYCQYDPSIVSTSISKGDKIIIYGISNGLVNIENENNIWYLNIENEIKIPSITALLIDTNLTTEECKDFYKYYKEANII